MTLSDLVPRLARIGLSVALAVGCHLAAGLPWTFSIAMGVVCFGVLAVMAGIHDPGFQSKLEERIDPVVPRPSGGDASDHSPSPPRPLR